MEFRTKSKNLHIFKWQFKLQEMAKVTIIFSMLPVKETGDGVQSSLKLLEQGDISYYLVTILVVRTAAWVLMASNSQKTRALPNLHHVQKHSQVYYLAENVHSV